MPSMTIILSPGLTSAQLTQQFPTNKNYLLAQFLMCREARQQQTSGNYAFPCAATTVPKDSSGVSTFVGVEPSFSSELSDVSVVDSFFYFGTKNRWNQT